MTKHNQSPDELTELTDSKNKLSTTTLYSTFISHFPPAANPSVSRNPLYTKIYSILFGQQQEHKKWWFKALTGYPNNFRKNRLQNNIETSRLLPELPELPEISSSNTLIKNALQNAANSAIDWAYIRKVINASISLLVIQCNVMGIPGLTGDLVDILAYQKPTTVARTNDILATVVAMAAAGLAAALHIKAERERISNIMTPEQAQKHLWNIARHLYTTFADGSAAMYFAISAISALILQYFPEINEKIIEEQGNSLLIKTVIIPCLALSLTVLGNRLLRPYLEKASLKCKKGVQYLYYGMNESIDSLFVGSTLNSSFDLTAMLFGYTTPATPSNKYAPVRFDLFASAFSISIFVAALKFSADIVAKTEDNNFSNFMSLIFDLNTAIYFMGNNFVLGYSDIDTATLISMLIAIITLTTGILGTACYYGKKLTDEELSALQTASQSFIAPDPEHLPYKSGISVLESDDENQETDNDEIVEVNEDENEEINEEINEENNEFSINYMP